MLACMKTEQHPFSVQRPLVRILIVSVVMTMLEFAFLFRACPCAGENAGMGLLRSAASPVVLPARSVLERVLPRFRN
jgi:hypothetical protein